MKKERLLPDYIFESSWEVCNKVGGIYTVLSTRANTLQNILKDRVVFIGPDCLKNVECPFFTEDSSLFSDWKQDIGNKLSIKTGRWNIPGSPIAILVDFTSFYSEKNDIYSNLWEDFQVDSLHAYGDYDEASMFSYAAAKVVESFYDFYINDDAVNVIYHGNEWMTGLGLLYIRKNRPQIATLFTTHATSIGRSIAGNNKPLYDYLFAYNGDQMADELNMQSKHSIEKRTAENVDCFTTVSDITNNECRELLDKPADVVLPNGFENDFVPKGAMFTKVRKNSRKTLLKVANALMGTDLDDKTLIISTSGRYEFRNKGIDVFIDAMKRLNSNPNLNRNVLAFIEVPGWVAMPRQDLIERITSDIHVDTALEYPMLTHWLHDMQNDNVLNMMNSLGMHNAKDDKVKVIFVPCYLNGDDGIFNMEYYDLIAGKDLCVYPSYYEPWGYTPLEAVAFKIPCVTTDLAGFGLWVNKVLNKNAEIEDGVSVINRTDYNYNDVADAIALTIEKYSNFTLEEVKKCRQNAERLSKKALWSKFIEYYYEAYDFALMNLKYRSKQ